jgi:hypothetical protein
VGRPLGCSQSLAGLLAVPLTLPGTSTRPQQQQMALATSLVVCLAAAAARSCGSVRHGARPVTTWPAAVRLAAARHATVCSAAARPTWARPTAMPNSAVARPSRVRPVTTTERQEPTSAATPVVDAVDPSVGRRLRTAGERAVVRTGGAGHEGSARSPDLVCSSAAERALAETVYCSASRFVARAREGWERAGERMRAPVTVRGRAPSTGCCTG